MLRTKAARDFLILFNSWYYSFSPHLADYITTHVALRAPAMSMLYPLIAALALSSTVYASLLPYPEIATLLSGLLASFLIGSFYLGLPLFIIKRKLKVSLKLSMWISVLVIIAGLLGFLVALKTDSSSLLMIATSMMLLFTVWSSAAFTSALISRLNFLKIVLTANHNPIHCAIRKKLHVNDQYP
jgi:FlaA1/EpsC-like NDP-sugar epimerase